MDEVHLAGRRRDVIRRPAGSEAAMSVSGEGFAGFGPQALHFLRALGFHQSKAWFDENRDIYERDVKAPLVALVAASSEACGSAGLPLRGDGRSVFRLNRDIRFSKDRRPYKTNAGAVLSPDGSKRSPGLLYIHIDPEGCFVAAGFWRPEPAQLLALRRAIAHDPKRFRTLLAGLRKAGLALGDGEALTRLPKGFEGVADAEAGAAIRMRDLVVRRPVPDARLGAPALAGDIVAFARDAEPLLRFGWSALDGPGPGASPAAPPPP